MIAFAMPGVWEIGIVVFLFMLLFGPKLLPRRMNDLGRSIYEAKRGIKEAEDAILGEDEE